MVDNFLFLSVSDPQLCDYFLLFTAAYLRFQIIGATLSKIYAVESRGCSIIKFSGNFFLGAGTGTEVIIIQAWAELCQAQDSFSLLPTI